MDGYNSIFGISLNDYSDGSVFAGEGTGSDYIKVDREEYEKDQEKNRILQNSN